MRLLTADKVLEAVIADSDDDDQDSDNNKLMALIMTFQTWKCSSTVDTVTNFTNLITST